MDSLYFPSLWYIHSWFMDVCLRAKSQIHLQFYSYNHFILLWRIEAPTGILFMFIRFTFIAICDIRLLQDPKDCIPPISFTIIYGNKFYNVSSSHKELPTTSLTCIGLSMILYMLMFKGIPSLSFPISFT